MYSRPGRPVVDELLSILDESAVLLASPESEAGIWSGFDTILEARAELERLRGRCVGTLDRDVWGDLFIWFMPTGSMQEIALESGWHDEYMELAARFDALYDRAKAGGWGEG